MCFPVFCGCNGTRIGKRRQRDAVDRAMVLKGEEVNVG